MDTRILSHSGNNWQQLLWAWVGIENNTDWNFKELEETMGNQKTLRKNGKEQKEILIGPSMGPRSFFNSEKFLCGKPYTHFVCKEVGFGSNFTARMANRQTKPWQF